MTESTPGSPDSLTVPPDRTARLVLSAAPANPVVLLRDWITNAAARGAHKPWHVTLATASRDGVPSSRTMQLLEIEDDALRFSTSFVSRKGVEIRETGRAAVSLYWRETSRSVNLTGDVVEASEEECDARFAAERRDVKASCAVCFQGRLLDDEEAQLDSFRALLDSEAPIPRPDGWKYFRVVPDAVTFWEGVPEALSRRLHYAREAGVWHRFRIEA
jgi:pyridoxamine 5'-phosphate oxidase